MREKTVTTALSLFSGGLDSILACRVVAGQGVRVLALKFITPFFDYQLLADGRYCEGIKEKYDIDLTLHNVSEEYLELLRAPPHGFGKHFNPCLDCKIFMMSKARGMMKQHGASFLISGEVVGQRPMSQRRDTMRVIERDSGCDGILLRPLCAKTLAATRPENEGLINRQLLYGFSGRGRKDQLTLAAELGITDYPNPAGGCILTDPTLGERIKRFYRENETVSVSDMRLVIVGRQFKLPGGSWLVLGRKQDENSIIAELAQPGDISLNLKDRPGPTAILRYPQSREDLKTAAGLVARYGKKVEGRPASGIVECTGGRNHYTGGNDS